MNKAFVFLAVISLPSLVFAAGGGAHGHAGIESLLWPAVNFGLYVCIMIYAFKRLGVPALKNLRAELESVAVREASEQAALNQEIADVRSRLENVSAEKEAIIAELESDGRSIADDVLVAANKKAEQLKTDVLKRASSERAKIVSDVRSEMLNQAIEKARDELKSSQDQSDFRTMLASLEQGVPTLFSESSK